jgi:hypothetical protein
MTAGESPVPADARRFLEALFGRKPDDLYLLFWTLPEKESRWFRDVEGAIRCAGLLSDHDLYVGIGLAGRDYGPKQRCLSTEIAGIVGMCADLDLRSAAHPKPTLPETAEQALSILPPEFPPSFVILTGNGLQVWWLFREPYVFHGDDGRQAATTLANRWHTLLRDNASRHGWTYDRLSDLARVLRVPGSTNCKDPSNLKPVVIHSQTDRRYNPSEFAEYLDGLAIANDDTEASATREWAERFKDTPLTINLAAQIPEDMLKRWLGTDRWFKNTWFRQRNDLHDQSQSGYDLALACFGFRAGLTEQQIVDLMVQHRSLHKQKPRTRLDYFQRTLAKAANRDSTSPARPISPDALAPPPFTAKPGNADDPSAPKINLCRHISAVLGVEVLRLVKLTGKDPLYFMELPQGKIEFPGVGKLLSQKFVRESIAARAGKLIPKIKPKLWEELVQMMLDACVIEDGGEELESAGAARIHLSAYLADSTFVSSIDDQIAQNRRKPMVREGRITVCASDIQLYITKSTQQSISVQAVAVMLVAIGAKTIRARGRTHKEQSRWELPLKEFDPQDYSVPQGGGAHDAHG